MDTVKLQLNVSEGTHRSLLQQTVVWAAEVANQRHPRTVPGWWLKPLVASGAPTAPSVCYHTARLPVSRTQTAAGWRVWIRYAAHLLQNPRDNDKFKLHVAVITKRGISAVSSISRRLSIDRMNGLKFIRQKSCVTSCCLLQRCRKSVVISVFSRSAEGTGTSRVSLRQLRQLISYRKCRPKLYTKVSWFASSNHETFVMFSDDTWLYPSRYMKSQNSRYCSAENPMIFHGVPLYDVKVGVVCYECFWNGWSCFLRPTVHICTLHVPSHLSDCKVSCDFFPAGSLKNSICC